MATKPKQDPQLALILEARHHNPFAWLGLQRQDNQPILRTLQPYAARVWLQTTSGWEELKRTHPDGLFTWTGKEEPSRPCLLRIEQEGRTFEQHDPYTFPPLTSDHDLHLFGGKKESN